MSENNEEIENDTEEHTPSTLYLLLRKLFIMLGMLFILWTYISNNFVHSPAPHPPQPQIANAPPAPPAPAAESAAPEPEEIAKPVVIPVNDSADVKLLQQRIEQLEAKLNAMPASENADKERIERLESQLADQTKIVQELKDKITGLNEQNTHKLAMLTSFGILKETVHSGESYKTALNQFYGLLAGDAKGTDKILEQLERLKPYAEQGAPTLSALQSKFDELLPIALKPDQKDHSWTQNLQSLVRIRKVGEQQQGSDDESILARAESKLHHHDLAGALKEMDALSAPAKNILADWKTSAESSITVEDAIPALQLAIANEQPADIAPVAPHSAP